MDVERGGDFGLGRFQKAKELDAAMAPVALTDDTAADQSIGMKPSWR